jgi:protein SCO1/2
MFKKAIIDNPKVMLSHTVFPEVDNVAILKAYKLKIDDKMELSYG